MVFMTPKLLVLIAAAGSVDKPVPLAWSLGTEYRYVWVQNGKRVGETWFRFEQDSKAATTSNKERTRYILKARRKNDYPSFSVSAQGTTTVRADGTPIRFEETLTGKSVEEKGFNQETHIYFEGSTAKLRYKQRGRNQKPHDVKIPQGTFIIATDTVEHWALFLSMLPPGFKTHEVQLLYPDFAAVMSTTIERVGKEKLKIGSEEIEVTRYAFISKHRQLTGALWLDAAGRLLQIEFANKDPARKLRVVLSELK
jgi:hypothetical protein